MKLKKLIALGLAAAMTVSMAACGGGDDSKKGNDSNSDKTSADNAGDSASGDDATSSDIISYADLKLGEDCTDLEAEITLYNHRTDMQQADYDGTTWDQYLAEFNKDYPNIKVNVETITDYAQTALLRLQSGDWDDIMMIPAIRVDELSTYFMPLGDLDTMNQQIRFASQWSYDGQVYGVGSTGNAQGIVYNKKVFKDAGITELPKTPEEFIDALKKIKESNSDIIPMYTNYAAGWTMGAWDAYLGGTATGDSTYNNQKLPHAKNPFSDPGNGAGPYNVYKVLYDAVAEGLTEEDYTTTDWEGCKGMINNGQIGCMVLGSWAVSQMQAAGDNADDIGYMSFPITIDGKQYASAGPDYSYAINKDASDTNKQASIVFIKWMTEKSGFSYNEGGMPVTLAEDAKWPDLYSAFDGIEYVSDDPALKGEETLFSDLNKESELNINNAGDSKIQAIVEAAANQDMSFDDIMNEWNEKWSAAQEAKGVEVTE